MIVTTGADIYGRRGTPWDDLPLDVLAGLPSAENKWHWGGPSPLTHQYAQYGRDKPGATWCYQTRDNSFASSAAYIFVANDHNERSGVGYAMEDAMAWFSAAGRMGIVFG